jgi:hypothetical protein
MLVYSCLILIEQSSFACIYLVLGDQKMTGKKAMGSSAAGTASAKKPSTTRKATRKATKAKGVPVGVVLEDEEEEEAALTLSVEDKDALECDICCLPFQSQVFMASSNYLACVL